MFTIPKVRPGMPRFPSQAAYAQRVRQPGDMGWYENPPGTVAKAVARDTVAPPPPAAPHKH
jgi:hypothetical protein